MVGDYKSIFNCKLITILAAYLCFYVSLQVQMHFYFLKKLFLYLPDNYPLTKKDLTPFSNRNFII